jgi:hypothetical protein
MGLSEESSSADECDSRALRLAPGAMLMLLHPLRDARLREVSSVVQLERRGDVERKRDEIGPGVVVGVEVVLGSPGLGYVEWPGDLRVRNPMAPSTRWRA